MSDEIEQLIVLQGSNTSYPDTVLKVRRKRVIFYVHSPYGDLWNVQSPQAHALPVAVGVYPADISDV